MWKKYSVCWMNHSWIFFKHSVIHAVTATESFTHSCWRLLERRSSELEDAEELLPGLNHLLGRFQNNETVLSRVTCFGRWCLCMQMLFIGAPSQPLTFLSMSTQLFKTNGNLVGIYTPIINCTKFSQMSLHFLCYLTHLLVENKLL